MTTQDYLNAFDTWLSQHIYAAMKSGKDLAFKERRVNCALKLDDDGAAWDYLLLDPGAAPPAGHAWSVYRLHGVHPISEGRPPAPPATAPRRNGLIVGLAQFLFGQRVAAQARSLDGQPALRLVG